MKGTDCHVKVLARGWWRLNDSTDKCVLPKVHGETFGVLLDRVPVLMHSH